MVVTARGEALGQQSIAGDSQRHTGAAIRNKHETGQLMATPLLHPQHRKLGRVMQHEQR